MSTLSSGTNNEPGRTFNLLHACFLLGLFLNLEVGGDMFLQKVGFQDTARLFITTAVRTLNPTQFIDCIMLAGGIFEHIS
jgi:hypothetical protein